MDHGKHVGDAVEKFIDIRNSRDVVRKNRVPPEARALLEHDAAIVLSGAGSGREHR
jgi:hypothetical protein